jgi:hypothetical protein
VVTANLAAPEPSVLESDIQGADAALSGLSPTTPILTLSGGAEMRARDCTTGLALMRGSRRP